MTYDVQLSALAIEDLIALHRWVSGEADIPTADGYLARIEDRIAALTDFPERGSPRDDLVAGLRTLTFERRLLIAYNVDRKVVTVQRVINAFRDLALDLSRRRPDDPPEDRRAPVDALHRCDP